MVGTVEDVLRVTEEELGNTDGAKYFEYFGYGDLGDWCMASAMYCVYKGGASLDWPPSSQPWKRFVVPDNHDCPPSKWLEPSQLVRGALVVFDWDADTWGDHVGICVSKHDWGCVTREGNTGNPRAYRERQRLWSEILGGMMPNYRHAEQDAGEPRNDVGIHYRAHTQDAGWLAPVHDGQTAGITGESLRLEAIKITPPEGVVFDVFAHVQDVGTLGYPNVSRGESSGTGSSDNDPIIGTVGRSKRLEAIMLRCVENPTGKRLRVQAHVQDVGWMEPVGAGEWAGTRGKSKRLEATRMWFE